jgi:hypothetical protein
VIVRELGNWIRNQQHFVANYQNEITQQVPIGASQTGESRIVADHYETLGVSKGATLDQIKKAYRKLSQSLHPDHGGSAEAFRELSQAYETLSDEESRSYYDETGLDPQAASDIVTSTIAQLAIRAFASDASNPVRWMCEQIDKQRDEHKFAKSRAETTAKNLQKKLQAFMEANEKSENIVALEVIAAAVRSQIAVVQRTIDSEEREIQLGTKILSALNGIRDRKPLNGYELARYGLASSS